MKLSILAWSTAAALCASAHATVISGTISDWSESGPVLQIGDGANHVSIWWSINTYDRGWFYGSGFTGDSDVAFASGVTDVTQITDASIYSYTSGSIGPQGDADYNANGIGDFIVWNNINTGHYGVLRLDDIDVIDLSIPLAELDGTWWFQTDGTGNFVPTPSTLVLLGLGALAARRRR
jgi:MYXO-CTERM domain-containing protein